MLTIALIIGFLFLILVVVSATISHNRKFNVKQFNGKYVPMSGKCFLFRHEKLGVMTRTRDMDKAMVFDTEAEALEIEKECHLEK